MSNDPNIDARLDAALSALPREVEPSRDLWPDIRAQLDATPAAPRTARFALPRQLAAGLMLMVITSGATYFVTRHALQPGAPIATMVATSNETSGDAIVAQYLRARADLDRQFSERLAALPPATRAKLESNLADLRRAENELVANISKNPTDPLLHDLLMSTYQSEAQLLADVTALAQPNT